MKFCPKCHGLLEYYFLPRKYACVEADCNYISEEKLTLNSFINKHGDTPIDEIVSELWYFLVEFERITDIKIME